MKTVQATIVVDARGKATITLPDGIPPGEYRVMVLIDDGGSSRPIPPEGLGDFPIIDVGPGPEGLALRRADMYGDEGR